MFFSNPSDHLQTDPSDQADLTDLFWGVAMRAIFFATVAFAGGVTVAQEPTVADPPARKTSLIVVTGAAGEPEFGEQFQASAKRWHDFAENQNWQLTELGKSENPSTNDHDLLKQAIEQAASLPADAELWIVMIGHGTFASNVAKFNLVGPDVSANDLSAWLKPVKAKCVI